MTQLDDSIQPNQIPTGWVGLVFGWVGLVFRIMMVWVGDDSIQGY